MVGNKRTNALLSNMKIINVLCRYMQKNLNWAINKQTNK